MPLSSLGDTSVSLGEIEVAGPLKLGRLKVRRTRKLCAVTKQRANKSIAVAAASQSSRSARTTSAFVRRKA